MYSGAQLKLQEDIWRNAMKYAPAVAASSTSAQAQGVSTLQNHITKKDAATKNQMWLEFPGLAPSTEIIAKDL